MIGSLAISISSSNMVGMSRTQPMQIHASLNTERARWNLLDGSLIIVAIGTLLALLLVLDMYEYVVIPGASKVKLGSRAKAGSLVPITAPVSESTATYASDQVESDIQQEIEKAKALIEQKRQELQNLSVMEVEAVAEKEGVDDTQLKVDHESLQKQELKQTTAPETKTIEDKVEQDKEEVIEEIVEKELGLDDWCPSCLWSNTRYSCDARVSFLKTKYHNEEESSKLTLLGQGFCSKENSDIKGGRRLLRGHT